MPPHTDESFVVGRYVENLGEIKKDKTYIIITSSEGITYKRLSSKNPDSITVEPDNVIYSPYDIKLSDILEIWEYVAHIGRNDSKSTTENASMDNLILQMSRDIRQLKNRLE